MLVKYAIVFRELLQENETSSHPPHCNSRAYYHCWMDPVVRLRTLFELSFAFPRSQDLLSRSSIPILGPWFMDKKGECIALNRMDRNGCEQIIMEVIIKHAMTNKQNRHDENAMGLNPLRIVVCGRLPLTINHTLILRRHHQQKPWCSIIIFTLVHYFLS